MHKFHGLTHFIHQNNAHLLCQYEIVVDDPVKQFATIDSKRILIGRVIRRRKWGVNWLDYDDDKVAVKHLRFTYNSKSTHTIS